MYTNLPPVMGLRKFAPPFLLLIVGHSPPYLNQRYRTHCWIPLVHQPVTGSHPRLFETRSFWQKSLMREHGHCSGPGQSLAFEPLLMVGGLPVHGLYVETRSELTHEIKGRGGG